MTDARTDQEIVQDALQLAGHQKHRYVPPFGTDIDQETRHGRSGDGGCLMCDATAALGRLVEARDTAQERLDYIESDTAFEVGYEEGRKAAEAERDTARSEAAETFKALGRAYERLSAAEAERDDALAACAETSREKAEQKKELNATRAERDVAIQERDDAQTLNARLAEDCKTAVTNWREAEADLGPALARLERVEAARQAIAELQAYELGMYRECRAEGSDAEAAQHDSRLTAYRKALALLAAALSDVTPPPRGSGS